MSASVKATTPAVNTDGWLRQLQAADMLGVSPNTVENWEAKGLLHPQYGRRANSTRLFKLYNPAELATVAARVRRTPVARPNAEGELTARVFELLEAGKSVREIVIKTRETQAKIEGIREGWLDAGGCDLVVGGTAKAELEKVIGPFETVIQLVERVVAREGATASNGNNIEAASVREDGDEDDVTDWQRSGRLETQRRREVAEAAAVVIIQVPATSRLATATDAEIDQAIVAAIDSAEALARKSAKQGVKL
jgi:hypothetical protein